MSEERTEFNMDEILKELQGIKSTMLTRADVEKIARETVEDRPTSEQVRDMVKSSMDTTSTKLRKQIEDYVQRMEESAKTLSENMQTRFQQAVSELTAREKVLEEGLATVKAAVTGVDRLNSQVDTFITLFQRLDRDIQAVDKRNEERDAEQTRKIERIEQAQSAALEDKTNLRLSVQRVEDHLSTSIQLTGNKLAGIENLLTSVRDEMTAFQKDWGGIILTIRGGLAILKTRWALSGIIGILSLLGAGRLAEYVQYILQTLPK